MSLVLGVGQESQRLWRFLNGAWHVPTLSAASPAVTHPIHPWHASSACGFRSPDHSLDVRPLSAQYLVDWHNSVASSTHAPPHSSRRRGRCPPLRRRSLPSTAWPQNQPLGGWSDSPTWENLAPPNRIQDLVLVLAQCTRSNASAKMSLTGAFVGCIGRCDNPRLP